MTREGRRGGGGGGEERGRADERVVTMTETRLVHERASVMPQHSFVDPLSHATLDLPLYLNTAAASTPQTPSGRTNRTVASTTMNLTSSRSHSLFTIAISFKRPNSDTLIKAKVRAPTFVCEGVCVCLCVCVCVCLCVCHSRTCSRTSMRHFCVHSSTWLISLDRNGLQSHTQLGSS